MSLIAIDAFDPLALYFVCLYGFVLFNYEWYRFIYSWRCDWTP